MALRVSVKQTNSGWAKKIGERLEGLTEKEVAGGFPRGSEKASQTYDNGASVLNVAAWNQFGTDQIPARPFMDEAVKIIEADTGGGGAYIAKQVIDGKMGADEALKKVAVVAEAAIKTAITDGAYEPNAPSTVRRKRSSKPLIDTGKMRQSVTSIIRDRSE